MGGRGGVEGGPGGWVGGFEDCEFGRRRLLGWGERIGRSRSRWSVVGDGMAMVEFRSDGEDTQCLSLWIFWVFTIHDI